MADTKTPFAIPPNAERVWRGWRGPALDLNAFLQRLGTVFIPATVEMQIKVGLDTYVPTIPGGLAGKPDTVPDETAILFWDSQQTYTDGFETLAVRTYTLTHAAVYTPNSRADFPTLFANQLTPDQPCYLFNKPADWMKGVITHLIGGPPANVAPAQFYANVAQQLTAIQSAAKLQGGIACVGNGYVVSWLLDSTGSGQGAAAAAALAGVCGWSTVVNPASTELLSGFWDKWPGMTVNSGDSFNMQFKRRWE